MAYLFSDGFDFYGSLADTAGRWSSTYPLFSNGAPALSSVTAFSSGLAFSGNSQVNNGNSGFFNNLTFSYGSNETTIYGSLRVGYRNASGNAAPYTFLTLLDGTNAQCTIRWNGDGSINLYSGGPTGTLLGSSYVGQFSLNSWDSFQFKIVINSTTGSIELRKNGGASNVITATGLNTRLGSTNAYANAVALGFGWTNSSSWPNYFSIDDFFLCSSSGAAPNTWVGDMRAVQQTPASTFQSQFSLSPASVYFQQCSTAVGTTFSAGSNTARFCNLTALLSGSVASLGAYFGTSVTGNARMALYDATGSGGTPGALIASTNAVVNPASGLNTFTFSSPPTVTKNTSYWVALLSDVTLQVVGPNTSTVSVPSLGQTYSGGFPASATGFSASTGNAGFASVGMNITTSNHNLVGELTEDGDSGYVYAATTGNEDIYTLSAIPTSYSVVLVNYLALMKKTDSGSRTASIMVTANGSADTAEATVSMGGSYTYASAPMPLDPTGAAWTPTNVNGAKLGLKIAS